jgi:hypothetical protein
MVWGALRESAKAGLARGWSFGGGGGFDGRVLESIVATNRGSPPGVAT